MVMQTEKPHLPYASCSARRGSGGIQPESSPSATILALALMNPLLTFLSVNDTYLTQMPKTGDAGIILAYDFSFKAHILSIPVFH